MTGYTTNMLMKELTRGHGLTRELESHLNPASELCVSLAQQILDSFEKSISMAKCISPATGVVADSPLSLTGSPGSESSELPPFKIARKKKKTEPKWTNQRKLGSGPEAEGPLDDGHSWRKYGQKEILGAKHPRGYYRCTHRPSQGCLAMKQVQRCDQNPDIFQVTYRGTHTCHGKLSPASSPAAIAAGSSHNNQLLLNFQTNLKVETEGLDSTSSLFFPSTPIEGMMTESHMVSPASTVDNNNCFKRSYTDAFISPATPESKFNEMGDSYMFDLDFLLQSSAELDAEFPFDSMSFFS